MRQIAVVLVSIIALSLLTGCSQAATSASPTNAPAPPAKAAAAAPASASAPATSAPAAAPTPASTAATYPEKGKTMTIIVPFAAGGSSDIVTRLVGAELQKQLGNGLTVQVVNKPGAGTQTGLTEMAQSKPDGYTFAEADLPAAVLVYMDPSRQAAFGRKDIQFVATMTGAPGALAVQASSPYKTLKDLVDAAKANPDKVKAGDVGVGTLANIVLLEMEKSAGISFAVAHFDGGAPNIAALLGGHEDVAFGNIADLAPKQLDGSFRVLGVADAQRSQLLPDVPTYTESGVPVIARLDMTLIAPAGTLKVAVDAVSAAVGKILADPSFKDKLYSQFKYVPNYKNAADTAAYVDQMEKTMPDIIAMFKH